MRWNHFLAVLLVLSFFPSSGEATTVLSVDLNTLIKTSKVIIHAEVASVTTSNLATKGKPQIVTDIHFRVKRTLKGTVEGSTFDLRQIGGHWEGYTLQIPGSPQFAKGEEVVLFLEWTGKRYTVCGMKQGKFTVTRNTSGDLVASRSLAGLSIVQPGPDGASTIVEGSKSPESLPLEKLFEAISRTTAQ